MAVYILRRAAFGVVAFLVASFLVFAGVRLIPGDVVDLRMTEAGYSETEKEAFREELGLTGPLPVQYAEWLWSAAHLDFGRSMATGLPVSDHLRLALPVTIELALIALLLASFTGVLLGTLAALNAGKWPDLLIRMVSGFLLAIPNFWSATLVITFGYLWFEWIPITGAAPMLKDPWTNLQQFIVPSIVLSLNGLATISRYTRGQVRVVLERDYIRTAYSKGLSTRVVIVRHMLRNSIIPIVTVIGVLGVSFVGGSIIIETVFSLPGLGRLMASSVAQRDYTMIQAIAAMIFIIVVIINMAIDISYASLDPRTRVR